MPTPANSPRALALSTLLAVEKGKYGNIAVDTVLKRTDMSEPDRHLYTALVYGVTERKTTLEFLLGKFSSRPLAELDGTVRLALCMGLYQLIYLDRVPDHAALDETVSLVSRKVSGFVNAVLRSYLRFEAALPKASDGSRAPRESKLTTPEALTAELTAAGLTVLPSLYASTALRVPEGAITATEAFQRGDFFVQDEASQLCVAALDARPGHIVADTCACPGSKSFGIALTMEN